MEDEPKREPRTFVLALSKPMGKKGGLKDGSFVAETRRQATEFYRDLVQGLMPPRTKPPKLREDEDKPPEPELNATEGEARREHEASLQRLAEVASFIP